MIDEEELWTAIAYDPGGTTGWALLCLYPEALNPGYRILDNVVFWTCGQFIGSTLQQGREMALLAAAWPMAHLVMEDFILRTFRMDRVLLEPIRVTESFAASLAALEQAVCCGQWAKHKCSNEINLAGYPPRSEPVLPEQIARLWKTGSLGANNAAPAGLQGYHLQQPSLAMSTMTDERLRSAEEAVSEGVRRGAAGSGGLGGTGLGFYSATRGLPHARDAVRHVLTFARREAQARSRGKSLHLPGGVWRPDDSSG